MITTGDERKKALFGDPELKKFCEEHNDPRVRYLWKRLRQSKSNAAKWCEAYNKLQDKYETILTQLGDA